MTALPMLAVVHVMPTKVHKGIRLWVPLWMMERNIAAFRLRRSSRVSPGRCEAPAVITTTFDPARSVYRPLEIFMGVTNESP